MLKTLMRLLPCLLVAWWVHIYVNGRQVHGGHYDTWARCSTARDNLVASYMALHPTAKVLGLCVWRNVRFMQ